MNLTPDFVRRHDRPGPRYTSYPPANHFGPAYTPEVHRAQVAASNAARPAGVSLYAHIPFCRQQCLYCGCNSELLREDRAIEPYLAAILAEAGSIAALLDPSRPVTQVHFGGGTPNVLSGARLMDLVGPFLGRLRLAPDAEVAVEADPALLDEAALRGLRAAGFNRISVGVQDFEPAVLQAVGRAPSRLPPRELVALCRTLGFASVNMDLIYGLPGQDETTFARTLERAIQAAPDRLVTFSYAHVPWMKERQKRLEPMGLPGPEAKIAMLVLAVRTLTAAGYEMIGMDHYARRDDDLAVAAREGTLHRNFQGYCTRRTTGQVYAVGASAISQLEGAYGQNERSAAAYVELMDRQGSAIVRGAALDAATRFRRDLINGVMCNGVLDLDALAAAHGLPRAAVEERVAPGLARLAPFRDEGLVEDTAAGFRVTGLGRLVVRNIAMLFDPLATGAEGVYSRTV